MKVKMIEVLDAPFGAKLFVSHDNVIHQCIYRGLLVKESTSCYAESAEVAVVLYLGKSVGEITRSVRSVKLYETPDNLINDINRVAAVELTPDTFTERFMQGSTYTLHPKGELAAYTMVDNQPKAKVTACSVRGFVVNDGGVVSYLTYNNERMELDTEGMYATKEDCIAANPPRLVMLDEE